MPRILIVKPSSLGDVVHTLPSAAMIAAALPDAEIDWVVNDSLAQIVGMYPRVRRIVPFPRKALGRLSLKKIAAFVHCLRECEYDAVIDYQGLLRSGIIASIARSPLRIGFDCAREGAPWFYHRRVALPPEMRHAADKNRFLTAEALDMLKVSYDREKLMGTEAELRLPEAWRIEADALCSSLGWNDRPQNAPMIAVGVSSRWKSKSWPEDFFAAVLSNVKGMAPGARLWLLGDAGDFERAENVRKLCSCPDEVVNLAGRTSLGGLAAMLARSDKMLTNDSGPMHIAAALKIPCVALFGATDDLKTGPYGPTGRHAVVHSMCEKSPCFRRVCTRDEACRICSQGVDPGLVAGKLLDMNP